ncbi:MAG: hypothetical protein KGQ82_10240 [Alphaproteobacteria bacterium]|nr:hypothetical protein [Alphaproteobacteria bacterium]
MASPVAVFAPLVMAGLDPAIRDFQDVDARNKSGHDGNAVILAYCAGFG